MPQEVQVRVDRETLEHYCEELQDCRCFLENFFLTCEPYRTASATRSTSTTPS